MAVSTWTQDCHDWNRSGWSPVDPVEGLTFAWQFNGSDGTGGLGTAASGPYGNHAFDAPREARPVCSPTMLFAPEGISPDDATVRAPYGIYAITKSSGVEAWHWPSTTNTQDIQCAPAYDATTDTLLVGSTDGFVYKLNANTGAVVSSYNAGSAIRKALSVFNGCVYAVCDDGSFHKITISSMALAAGWTAKYAGTTAAQTPPAYCVSTGSWVYCTQDLYVHCVKDADGSRVWRVNPTNNGSGGTLSSATTDSAGRQRYVWTYGVPVVAEMHRMVFVTLRIDNETQSFSRTGDLTPGTQAELRAWIQAHPSEQNLFALNLADGTQPFIPARAWGSTEWVKDSGGLADGSHVAYGVIGQWPIVKVWPNGDETLYIEFKSMLPATKTMGPRTVTAASWASGVATLTISPALPAGYGVGSTFVVTGINPSGFNNYGANPGSWTMATGSGGTTIKYALTSNPGAYVSGGTATDEQTDDGRWANALGEMVLDSTTVSGMSAGDFRFVRAANFVGASNTGAYQGKSMAVHISDEQSPLSGAGSSIFNTHWLVSEGWNITDRSAAKGYNQPFNPITTTDRRIHMHSPKNAAAYSSTHTDAATSNPGSQEEDATSRTWPVTGLTYGFDKTGVSRPPLSSGPPNGAAHAMGYYWNTSAYSCGFRPRYTVVSDGYVFIIGNGGEITAFTHSGTGGATTIGLAA